MSPAIVTRQGGTQLQPLLSSLNSRLLILPGPHSSRSISAGFCCSGFPCCEDAWLEAAEYTGFTNGIRPVSEHLRHSL